MERPETLWELDLPPGRSPPGRARLCVLNTMAHAPIDAASWAGFEHHERGGGMSLYESISPLLQTALPIRRRCRQAICSCSHRDPCSLSFVLRSMGAFSAAPFLKMRGAIAMLSRFEMGGNGSLADKLRKLGHTEAGYPGLFIALARMKASS
jgi:hypothetical protein